MTEVIIKNGIVKTLPSMGISAYDSAYSQSSYDPNDSTKINLFPFNYTADTYLYFDIATFVLSGANGSNSVNFEFSDTTFSWPAYDISSNIRYVSTLSASILSGFGCVGYFKSFGGNYFITVAALSYTYNGTANNNSLSDIKYTIAKMQLYKDGSNYFVRCIVRNKFKILQLSNWDEVSAHTFSIVMTSSGSNYTVNFYIDDQLASVMTFVASNDGYASYNWPNSANADTFYVRYADNVFPNVDQPSGYVAPSMAINAAWILSSFNLFSTNYSQLVDLCMSRYNIDTSTTITETSSGTFSTATFGSSTFNGTFGMW